MTNKTKTKREKEIIAEAKKRCQNINYITGFIQGAEYEQQLASTVKGEVTDEEIEIKLLQIADEMPDAEPDYFDALVDGFRKCAKWMRSLQEGDK